MARLVGTSLILLALFSLSSVEVQAQKDKKKVTDPTPTVDSDKLSTGEFVGMVKSTPNTERNFTVTVETQKLVYTGKGGNTSGPTSRIITLQNKIAADQAAMLKAKTASQRNRYQQNLVRDQNQLQQAINQLNAQYAKNGGLPPGYKVDVTKTDVDFQTAEAVKVRTMVLPTEFDEKGNKKTYSKKELEEMKGKDKTLPGYESSLDKVEVGMKVRVVLGRAPTPKKTPTTESTKAEKDKAEKDKEPAKDKDTIKDPSTKDKDEPADENKKMQVKQIIILEEAPATVNPKGNKK